MFSRPKILFLVSLLFVALLNPKFNPYLPFKFLIFYHSSTYTYRDAPNMLKNLPIIPSRTSQNVSLLLFKIPPIIPKLFRSDSKKITAIATNH